MSTNEDMGGMSAEVAVMVLRSTASSDRALREAAAALAGLITAAGLADYDDQTDEDGVPLCWHFVGYRTDSPEGNRDNPPELPQYQGAVFADSTVAMRWLTPTRSTSVWESFADMFDAHGRPEYGTRIAWPAGAPAEALRVIAEAEVAHQAAEAVRLAPETPSPGELAMEQAGPFSGPKGYTDAEAEVFWPASGRPPAEPAVEGFASVQEAADAGVLDEFLNRPQYRDDRDAPQ